MKLADDALCAKAHLGNGTDFIYDPTTARLR
jgi:hypothetical protein